MTATTLAAPDTTPPSVPTNVATTVASSSQINLSWVASTDPVVTGQVTSGVAGYKVYKNGTQVATTTTTKYSATGLTASTSYSFTVSAYDAVGNSSGQSAPVTATTLASPDTTPPSVPANIAATVASSSQINLSWAASTDPVVTGQVTSGVVGYKVYKNGTQVATTTATNYSSTGLSASTAYSFTVSAYDAAGNSSAQSATVTATTPSAPDTTPPSVPSNLTATVASSSQINLSWAASTDTIVTGQATSGVAGYKVYRNGIQVTTTTVASYSATSLSAATSYSFTVSAYDAASNSSAQSAAVTATTLPVQTPPATTSNIAFATKAGGQYTDQSGVLYRADTDYSGGSTVATPAKISGTVDGPLYQRVRYGNFSYNIPLASGNYTVTLKFAEIYWNTAGRRVFDVKMQGQTVISNLDIFSHVGRNAAYGVSIPVNVTNGVLNIQFTSIVDYACVSAIVVQAGTEQVTPPVIQLNPASLSFSAAVGTNPSSQTIGLSNIGGGTLNWTVVADNATPAWLSVHQGSGINNATLTVSVNSASLTPGQYSKNITISALGATNTPQTVNVALSVTPKATGTVVFATNAGGGQYTDQSAVVYQADMDYSGGLKWSTMSPITGKVDGALYRSVRFGNFSYKIPLANGNYTVKLKFAELYWNAAGQRIFNVSMQGQTVISNLDIFSHVGRNAAYDVSIPVNVTNGVLNIQFTSIVDYACVSAIEVSAN